MKNKTLSMIAIAASLFLLIGTAAAFQGNFETNPNYSEELHEQMTTAIDNGDYASWIQLREENNLPMRGRMFSVINEDNFSTFQELHNAQLSGDYEKANEIRESLGLGQGQMKHGNNQGQMNGFGRHNNWRMA